MWTSNIGTFSSGPRIAIGLKRDDQTHVGLLYRPRDSAPSRFLHLAWHLKLVDAEIDEGCGIKYARVDVRGLPSELTPVLLAYCRRVAQDHSKKGLPYGFGFRPDLVSDEGTSLQRLGFSGYTCATFVLAVLRDLNLIDPTLWKEGNDDAGWKSWVVEALRVSGASPGHIAAVEKDAIFTRVQPIHVAAAATVEARPAEYEATIECVAQIRAELRQPS